MNDKLSRLIWIDLEMTGLDPQKETIIEIATLITDDRLNLIAEGPNLVIHQSDEILNKMDEWNTKQHGQSGLINKVKASTLSIAIAEEETLRFLQQYVPPHLSPMCGNTVSQDRRFLNRYMPRLEAYFHYRHLDVSTVKELAKMWAPSLFDGFKKAAAHRALDDIKESVEELRYYQHCFFKLPVKENGSDLPINLYDSEHVKALDRLAIEEAKIAPYDLMCRAGQAAFDLLLKKWPAVKSIDIVCGPGNNGGDGFVLARLAKNRDIQVNVYQAGVLTENKNTPERHKAQQAWQNAGGHLIAFEDQPFSAEVIVDALLGTGTRAPLPLEFQKVIDCINQSQRPVLALDVPSGLNPNTGGGNGGIVKATATITFVGMKIGLLQAIEEVGELYFNHLNIPKESYSKIEPQAFRLAYSDIIKVLPSRKRSTHKGEQGHVCVIGGGHTGYSGAVALAGEAALRVGAGLVSAIVAPGSLSLLARAPKELMCYGYQMPDKLSSLLEKITVLVIGSGMGQGEWGELFFHAALQTKQRKVIDADGLNWLAQHPQKREDWILTPHPGEAARLLKETTQAIEEDRIAAARLLSKTYGGVIVLKGASTIVIDQNDKLFIQAGGIPILATGGTGDVLAGVIGGLLAQGLSLSDAALLGVSVHATAAVQIESLGERGLLASDLLWPIRGLVN